MFSYQMFATTLSALYGKLLVVMGIAFPMAEVISTYIPPSFYEVNIKKRPNFQSFIYCKNDGSQIAISSIILCIFSGVLFVSIRRQYVIFIFYVYNVDLGSTKSYQSKK